MLLVLNKILLKLVILLLKQQFQLFVIMKIVLLQLMLMTKLFVIVIGLDLMKGDLKSTFEKNGKTYERKLNPDRSYISKDGKGLKLHGRSLLLVRNVGHLMTNPAITLKDGSEIPEGIMDAFITSAACLHDIKKKVIQEVDLFILLNQKCMVLMKLHLQI